MNTQIKVKDTRMHRVQHSPTRDNIEQYTDIPVAEAKLVLVECKPKEGLIYIPNWKCEEGNLRVLTKDVSLSDAVYKAFKPILISETEKIEVGDWRFLQASNVIAQTNENEERMLSFPGRPHLWNKVLALPEHFSPKHLQAIVDGKMKDGDKVLVECEDEKLSKEEIKRLSEDETYAYYHTYDKVIKLNQSNHITLHKIEEKMYTRDELINVLISYRAWAINYKDRPTSEKTQKWFEQNVK